MLLAQIRLSTGSFQTIESKVEVHHNGNWKEICEDTFTKADADTVCRIAKGTSALAHGTMRARSSSKSSLKLPLYELPYFNRNRPSGTTLPPTVSTRGKCTIMSDCFRNRLE